MLSFILLSLLFGRGDDYLALTFDDGPHKRQTPRLLRVLNKYPIQTTFFPKGNRIKHHTGILFKILERHEIGNHTMNHLDLWRHSCKVQRREISEGDMAIHIHLGITAKVFRPPSGVMTKCAWKELRSYQSDYTKYQVVTWDHDLMDIEYGRKKRAIPIARLRRLFRPGHSGIVLMHSMFGFWPWVLETLLERKRDSLHLVTVSQYLKVKKACFLEKLWYDIYYRVKEMLWKRRN